MSATEKERTETTLERVRRRPSVKPADELIRADRVTKAQHQRARESDKFPRWTEPYLHRILRKTLYVYAGVQMEPSRSHLFVIGGLLYEGVYDAEEAWTLEVGGSFADTAFDRWNRSTRATALGDACRVLLGGRIISKGVRGSSGDEGQTEIDFDAPAREESAPDGMSRFVDAGGAR